MATVVNALRKKKLPKTPKMNASKRTWDNHEKKKKSIIAFNNAVENEKKRRIRIKALKAR